MAVFVLILFSALAYIILDLTERVTFLESVVIESQLNQRVTKIDQHLGFIKDIGIEVDDTVKMQDEIK